MRNGCVGLCALAALLSSARVQAASRHVPDDVSTIAGAMALSAAGDTVLVAPGTYAGSITLASGVTLKGDGPRESVVLDAQGAGAAVVALSPQAGTRLEGLHLTGGAGRQDGGATVGGNLCVQGGTLAVNDCSFGSSNAVFGGGSAATSANVTFTACAWAGTNGLYGGGHFQSGGTLMLEDATFVSTAAQIGGALFATAGAQVTVHGAVVTDAVASTDGGALHFDTCVASLSNARIDRARAGGTGGAIAVRGGGQVLAAFCVFVESESGAGGGAFHVSCEAAGAPGRPEAASPACALLSLSHVDVIRSRGAAPAAGAVTGAAVLRISSSIVAGNLSGLACLDPRATLDVTCSDLYQNGGTDLTGGCLPALDPANLAVDPRLCDLAGRDFGLCANSPLANPPACGSYWGAEAVTCADCGPTAAARTTWGALKAQYR